jgi:hypothetical protein
MKMQTNVKAGAPGKLAANHNSTLRGGLRVRSAVSAGKMSANHNSTLGGLKVRTALVAGKPAR